MVQNLDDLNEGEKVIFDIIGEIVFAERDVRPIVNHGQISKEEVLMFYSQLNSQQIIKYGFVKKEIIYNDSMGFRATNGYLEWKLNEKNNEFERAKKLLGTN